MNIHYEYIFQDDFEEYDDDFEEDDDDIVEQKLPQQQASVLPKQIDVPKTIAKVNKKDEEDERTSTNTISKLKPKSTKSDTTTVSSSDNQSHHTRSATQSIRIDFHNATTELNYDAVSVIRRRHRQLKSLVQLDKSESMLLLDMAPIRDYEFYIQSFGKTGRLQVRD